jgi:hypothetical protein
MANKIDNKYIKIPYKNRKTTSVSISLEQDEFIKKHKINFSLVVQDALTNLMDSFEKSKKTKK